MSDTESGFEEEFLTIREHTDPDKHWMGESLPVPTTADIAAVTGSVSSAGNSKFPARADHGHAIGPNTITAANIVAGAIGNSELATDAVSAAKIATNAVTADAILAGAVGNAELGADAVTASKIASETITGAELSGALSKGSPFTSIGWSISDSLARMAIGNNDVSSANLGLYRYSPGNATGDVFIHFVRSGTISGSVTIATATTVNYNASSDKDMKNFLEDIDDEKLVVILDKIMPLLYEWKAEPGVRQIGYFAQDVAKAWPAALKLGLVSPSRTIVDPDTGEEMFLPWCMDLSKLVPLLHAGWQIHQRRFASLEARVAALEAA